MGRRLKMWVLSCAMTLPVAAVGAEEVLAPSNEDLARELMKLTGAGELGKQAMVQLVDAFRGMNPEIPQEFWDEFIAGADPDQLAELGVPIYVKHLTRAELEAAVAFYSSPEGKSLVAKLPAVMQESMAAGEQWGQQLGAQIVEKLDRYRAGEAQGKD